MQITRRQALAGAGITLISAGASSRARAQAAPFRFIVNVGLQNLDPISSPSFVTRNFAYLVFDTLVSMDSKGAYKPQMLQGWEISGDNLTWNFTLRPGLKFHDGSDVTAEDCVASLKRWGGRDSIGRRLLASTESLTATDARHFVLKLAKPFGGVLEALGKPSVHVPFIMPARIANATPPSQQVQEIMGSGPFIFQRAGWIPGERASFTRNANYVPREEPADGLAGGKVVKLDRVEMATMADPGLRVAALQTGEVDYLEYAPVDYLPRLRTNRQMTIAQAGGQANLMYCASLNHFLPPFDNVLMRRAVQQALDRTEVLAGAGFGEGLGQPDCASLFMCGAPYSSTLGSDIIQQPSLDRAKALLQQAGYKNERVVLLHPADSPLLNPYGLVMIDRLKRAGFNLDVQASDWASIAQRWVQRQPLDQGGWNIVPVVYTGFDLANPLSNMGVGFNCTDNQPWGYCVDEMSPVLAQFEAESDPAKRREYAAQLQKISFENATFPIAGQFRSPAVWRAELKGVIDFGFPVIWNIEKPAR
ncbi:ABC transporter substrate-binding protein [Roseomonas frigidaquae]|uniref:ABC transporter substrate-binding protein n=1 Tax=Falsiroseomonas frigidaquae TaxID=487318 RepID=A0ABX1ESM0_9PROT|nr:ABC transporter substrate-binding protein [Falsiroseomonas frigidaquae]NKE43619.1 ABC transporter substrate-binding protein [Falsiroseomonas frigidaquae]